MFSAGSSQYIFNLNPRRFSSRQDDYLRQVDETVTTTVNRIRHAVNEGNDLTSFFHETLHFLGTIRHNIAREHGTSDAEMYGKQRDGSSAASVVMRTGLYEVYKEYNNRLLPKIQNHLRTMKHTLREFKQTELKVAGKTCMGRRTSMDFSILTEDKRTEWHVDFSRSNYERLCGVCSIVPLDESNSIGNCFNHLMSVEVMRLIKEQSIEDYKRLKIMHVIKDIYTEFAGRKSDWVLVTLRCEMHGKMYALTQYLTWMYRTFQHDPVDYMTNREDPTVISLCHQDVFLIKETLKDIAGLFKQAIEWNREDTQELLNLVGLMNYLFAHAMPFERGSAAISEWLEMAIYRYHGLELKYAQAVNVNMEALTLPLDEFIKKYPSIIQLEPIAINPSPSVL